MADKFSDLAAELRKRHEKLEEAYRELRDTRWGLQESLAEVLLGGVNVILSALEDAARLEHPTIEGIRMGLRFAARLNLVDRREIGGVVSLVPADIGLLSIDPMTVLDAARKAER